MFSGGSFSFTRCTILHLKSAWPFQVALRCQASHPQQLPLCRGVQRRTRMQGSHGYRECPFPVRSGPVCLFPAAMRRHAHAALFITMIEGRRPPPSLWRLASIPPTISGERRSRFGRRQTQEGTFRPLMTSQEIEWARAESINAISRPCLERESCPVILPEDLDQIRHDVCECLMQGPGRFDDEHAAAVHADAIR